MATKKKTIKEKGSTSKGSKKDIMKKRDMGNKKSTRGTC